MGLHNRGFRGIDLLTMPFTKRPEREVMFRHRPDQFEGPDPRSLAALSGGSVYPYDAWRHLDSKYDSFLVCGSNLIEPDFANTGKVLNVHAGLIPLVRGLDSFKWSILLGYPLGNTLHCIDQEADAGEVLAHLETPVFKEDDLGTLASRHYANEIWMLINFDRLTPRTIDLPKGKPTKRMPIGKEAEMLRAFESYKEAHVLRLAS